MFDTQLPLKQGKKNGFMIAKEVFIDHHVQPIQKKYQIDPNCLGQGGFGQVFSAQKRKKLTDSLTSDSSIKQGFSELEQKTYQSCQFSLVEEIRAIKKITCHSLKDKQFMENQMEILSYLDHPSVEKLYETFEFKKDFYLVTDLLKGGDLFNLINEKGPLKEADAKNIFQQIIRVLCYLHSQHICHRDLKLENILLVDSHSFNIKVVDFGLAYCWDCDMKKELIQNDKNSFMTGTPDYMSPQMLAKNYDEKCDIWAAGIILYIILSGQAPFSGKNDKQTMKRIRNLQYTVQIPQLANTSKQAKSLIQKILKPQSERIQLQEILNDPWVKDVEIQECESSQQTQRSELFSKQPETPKVYNLPKQFQKLKKHKSVGKLIRKWSSRTFDHSQYDSQYKSCYSQNFLEKKLHKLTIPKLQHFSTLSNLEKFVAIFSISKLSSWKTLPYEEEFYNIDKDHNGTISIQDFKQYLKEEQNYTFDQRVDFYFHDLALAQRDYISFTEYLTCMLSYEYFQAISQKDFSNPQSEAKDNIIKKCSKASSKKIKKPYINIFHEERLLELFSFLDKDSDKLISQQDFYQLFKKCGIVEENQIFLKELQNEFSKIYTSRKNQDEDSYYLEWSIYPKAYRQHLTRGYKGSKQNESYIDFQTFKSLIISKRQTSYQHEI